MATFKAVIRKGQVNKKGLSNIKIQVIHRGTAVYLRTDHYIEPGQMLPSGRVKATHPNSAGINKTLSSEILGYEEKLLKINGISRTLNAFQVKEFLTESPREGVDFFQYAEKRLQEIRKRSEGTFRIYQLSVKMFKKFVGTGYLPFRDINKSLLERFEQFSRENGRSVNTISVYLRSIRAIFNDAVQELNRDGFEPVIMNYPFRHFRIREERTRKRNLSVEVIRQLRDASLIDKHEIIARDVFMLIFYLIGINIKDLFYLREMKGERIEYCRAKTGTRMSIKVEPEALEIFSRYRGEKYLLRFADHCQEERAGENRKPHQRYGDQYQDHRAFTKLVNKKLKDIAAGLGIEEPISTYWARHSWATIARNECRISKDDIALCLGHQDPGKKVTDIYLNEDRGIADLANRFLLDHLKNVTTAPEPFGNGNSFSERVKNTRGVFVEDSWNLPRTFLE